MTGPPVQPSTTTHTPGEQSQLRQHHLAPHLVTDKSRHTSAEAFHGMHQLPGHQGPCSACQSGRSQGAAPPYPAQLRLQHLSQVRLSKPNLEWNLHGVDKSKRRQASSFSQAEGDEAGGSMKPTLSCTYGLVLWPRLTSSVSIVLSRFLIFCLYSNSLSNCCHGRNTTEAGATARCSPVPP